MEEAEKNLAGAQVPVNLDPGYPVILRSLTFSGDSGFLSLIARYRGSLQQANEGCYQLRQLAGQLEAGNILADDAIPDALTRTRQWAAALLAKLDANDPLKRILAFDVDILGVYEYAIREAEGRRGVNRATIRLYWGVIALAADWMNCGLEDLATVVLTHELAHAYSQLGADIDGRRWLSSDFHRTHVHIVEGLAQFYTHRVLSRLSNRLPGAWDAYQKLLAYQPKAHHTHLEWVKYCSPEAVRLAMLELRRRGVTTPESFKTLLRDANGKLKHRWDETPDDDE